MKLFNSVVVGALLAAVAVTAVLYAPQVQAQQPGLDSLDIDEDACTVSVEWIDGTDDTETIEVFVNDIRTVNLTINDIVGNQGRVVAEFEADEGDEILAVLTANGGEDEYSQKIEVGECPKPTSTPAPAPTATPIPTVAPIPTPIVIVQEKVVEKIVEVPVKVSPPSTGDGGLLD